jgi:cytochrome P450
MVANKQQYDLFASEVLGNPYPVYARMRAETPVYKNEDASGNRWWLLTRYEDSVNFLKDDRYTKEEMRVPGRDPRQRNQMQEAAAAINHHMLMADPPDHTRLRGLVHKAFTPRIISELTPRIQSIADGLLDKVEGQSGMELIRDYAVPLPVTVIAELLGVPAEDQATFRRWSQTIIVGSVTGRDMENVGIASLEFIMYFHDMFDKRRADPKDDLISALVQVEEAGDKLDTQELISMVFLLLVAGHETTVNLIGNGSLALLRHPDQMEKLRANPDLIKTAVEEMLRYDGPIGESTVRWALEDIDLNGHKIAAGDMVFALLLAANRDPEAFENPDLFDITRNPNKHLAFGHGIHYCLGAPLARIEGAIAINTLLRRLPKLRLAVNPDDLKWNETLLLHGMSAMPVEF